MEILAPATVKIMATKMSILRRVTAMEMSKFLINQLIDQPINQLFNNY